MNKKLLFILNIATIKTESSQGTCSQTQNAIQPYQNSGQVQTNGQLIIVNKPAFSYSFMDYVFENKFFFIIMLILEPIGPIILYFSYKSEKERREKAYNQVSYTATYR